MHVEFIQSLVVVYSLKAVYALELIRYASYSKRCIVINFFTCRIMHFSEL